MRYDNVLLAWAVTLAALVLLCLLCGCGASGKVVGDGVDEPPLPLVEVTRL